MEIKKSDLIFVSFNVNASLFKEYLFPLNTQEKILKEFPIDINLKILRKKKENNNFKIKIDVSGNINKNAIPGYGFSVLASGIFIVNNFKTIEKTEVDNLLYGSAVPMVLNSIRGYLHNISSFGIYGKYLLPSIDIKDLISKYKLQRKKSNIKNKK
jgi:preprotein translocase subunit SecB